MRYYFDILDDHFQADDQEGIDLGGNEAAWNYAVRVATAIAGDAFTKGGSLVTVTVRDPSQPLFAVKVGVEHQKFTT